MTDEGNYCTISGGLNCAQAVAGAFAAECGVDEATVRKMACGFGGGLAHTGRTCGAVSGAVLAFCRRGPPAARVTGVEVADEAYDGAFETFSVRH